MYRFIARWFALTFVQGVHEEIQIETGSMVKITVSDEYKEAVDEQTIWVDYKNIVNVLDIGKQMFIDDGLIGLVVKEKGKLQV